MITLNKQCEKHIPHKEAISFVQNAFMDYQFTFCESCEQDIQRIDYDGLKWSKWHLTR